MDTKDVEPFRQLETRNLAKSLKSHLARNKPAESFFHVSFILFIIFLYVIICYFIYLT